MINLRKTAIYILRNEDNRKRIFTLIWSITVGFLGLMCLPAVVLIALGSTEFEISEVDKIKFNETDFIENLDSEQQMEIADIQSYGQEIENAMTNVGVRSQTIKAQMIYMSYFKNIQNFNVESYAELFAKSENDIDLIDNKNSVYGLRIDYEEFMKSYTWIMNVTINSYMFENPEIKNSTDLSAWVENAYISGWGYEENAVGKLSESDRIRCVDNDGLILGYLKYDCTEKVFRDTPDIIEYVSKGTLDTMPDTKGVILFDGKSYGVYVGNGEVIFSCEENGYVTKDLVSNGLWNSWSEITEIYHNPEIVFEDYNDEKKNNLGLVQWAVQAYENGWGVCLWYLWKYTYRRITAKHSRSFWK